MIIDTPTLRSAFDLAVQASESVRGTTNPNPAVGAVLLSPAGEVLGVGATQPPGGAHAEVMALREAGARARGAVAVVTLEPCNHTGRTGPCSHALAEAGVSAVYYANPDPNPEAVGGAAYLRSQGIVAEHCPYPTPGLEPWLSAIQLARPHVTLKMAHTLDGFTAAADGTSQWITGSEAREFVHLDRSKRDAIIVGTGTVLADDPKLTARMPNGELYPHQPRRIVIGNREVPVGSNLEKLGYQRFSTITEALEKLHAQGCVDVLVEGGATLAAAFIEADLVDMLQSYVAPAFLGTGRGVLEGWTSGSISAIKRFELVGTQVIGNDVLITSKRVRS